MMINSLRGLLALFLCVSLFVYIGCSSSNDPGPVDCATTDLAVTFTFTDPTSCGTNNGTITANAAGGAGPYQYALDAQTYSANSNFTGLGAGTYQIKLKDKNGCERTTSVILKTPGSSLEASAQASSNSGCKTNNGSITINATGGSAPYSYSINNGAASMTNTIGSLAAGNYTVKVTDNIGCSVTQNVRVMSGIKLSAEIKTIIDASCAVTGCHVAGGAAVSFTTLSNIISNAGQIKIKTESGEMPKGGTKLPQEQLNAIACWVDDGAPNN